MLSRRPPKWVFGVGIIAVVLGVNAVLAFVNFVTASPTNCLTCHGTGGTPDMSNVSLVHPGYDRVKCVSCHSKPGQYVLVEGYKGGFSADPSKVSTECLRCHPGMSNRADVAGFKSNTLSISVSHKAHLDRGAVCTDCHRNIAHDSSPQPTNRPRMEYCFTCHNQAAASCTTCHGSSIPAGVVSPIPWTEPVQISGGSPPDIPHSLEGRSSCLVCHQNGVGGAPKAPVTHAGRTNDMCQACHKPVTGIGNSVPASPPKIPHSLDGRSACLICHQSGIAGAPRVPDSHAGRTNDVCQSCHQAGVPVTTTALTTTTPAKTPAPTIVPTVAPTTAPAPQGAPKIPHSVDGRSACLVCHQDGLMGAPKVPGSHVGRANEMCPLCHKT